MASPPSPTITAPTTAPTTTTTTITTTITTNKRKRSPSSSDDELSPSSPCDGSTSPEASGSNGGDCNSSSSDASMLAPLATASEGEATNPVLGPPRKKKKRVSFDGVTVFYFRRSQGFTSVPSQGGSTLGMLPKHEVKKSFSLCDYSKEQERIHRIVLKRQLIEKHQQQLLENSGPLRPESEVSEDEIEDELNSINISEYYFLQPIPTKQRRALLRIAGVKKVDNVEKLDLKRIRISRESCGCDCRVYCNPATCSCALAGIKCQVDRLSFPCGCTKDGCTNPLGRVEFNPVRVQTHFIHTIMRVDAEKNTNGGKNFDNEQLVRTSSASCSKPCCDGSASSVNAAGGYAGVMNGQSDLGAATETNRMFSGQVADYEPLVHHQSIEGSIPVEVKQHLNVQDLIPRMLHYNDAEDGLLHHHNHHHHHHHHHVGLGCSTDPIASSIGAYSGSDDSMLTTSSESSSSDSYQYSQCQDDFNHKDEPADDFTDLSKADTAAVVLGSTAECVYPPSTPPVVKPTPLGENADLPSFGLHLESSNTFTDLTSHMTAFSSSFSGSSSAISQAARTPPEGFTNHGLGSVLQRPELCSFDNGSISSSAIVADSPPCTTASSGYTILSALNAIDPLEEMRETKPATDKISPASPAEEEGGFHGGRSEFHELQNCSAESVASGMVKVGCPQRDEGKDQVVLRRGPTLPKIDTGEQIHLENSISAPLI